jgi:SAM-dependent methyltransferase
MRYRLPAVKCGSRRIPKAEDLHMAGVEDIYRSEFRERVLAGRPRSLLEVGCGSGLFLRSVRDDVIRLAGIDPDSEAVDALHAEGFEVSVGHGEALPFRDGDFDVVVFSFVPHHCSAWAVALREAVRVARHSVEILDIWFDESVPDQRVARDFDGWCRQVDRLGGMVHNAPMSPGELLAPLAEKGLLAHDYACRRMSAPWPQDDRDARIAERRALAAQHAGLREDLERILADARRLGMSDIGCVQMTVELGG